LLVTQAFHGSSLVREITTSCPEQSTLLNWNSYKFISQFEVALVDVMSPWTCRRQPGSSLLIVPDMISFDLLFFPSVAGVLRQLPWIEAVYIRANPLTHCVVLSLACGETYVWVMPFIINFIWTPCVEHVFTGFLYCY